MTTKEEDSKIGRRANNSEKVSLDDAVYLTEEYYTDTKATVLDVPRYGWKVKLVYQGVATLEYQRANWKLLMTLILETKYLKKDI